MTAGFCAHAGTPVSDTSAKTTHLSLSIPLVLTGGSCAGVGCALRRRALLEFMVPNRAFHIVQLRFFSLPAGDAERRGALESDRVAVFHGLGRLNLMRHIILGLLGVFDTLIFHTRNSERCSAINPLLSRRICVAVGIRVDLNGILRNGDGLDLGGRGCLYLPSVGGVDRLVIGRGRCGQNRQDSKNSKRHYFLLWAAPGGVAFYRDFYMGSHRQAEPKGVVATDFLYPPETVPVGDESPA